MGTMAEGRFECYLGDLGFYLTDINYGDFPMGIASIKLRWI